MKKLKNPIPGGQMGINLGGHQLVLSGGSHPSTKNFHNKQHQLRPPQPSSYNAAPSYSNVTTNITKPVPPFPVLPTNPLPPTIPLPPNIPAPPSIVPLPPNLPPPPAIPLPPGPMPQVPCLPSIQNRFNSPQQPAPSSFVPSFSASQSTFSAMPPPLHFSSNNPSLVGLPSASNIFTGQSELSNYNAPSSGKLTRSNSLDSLIDYMPNKRRRKSPSRFRYNKPDTFISKHKRSGRSKEPLHSKSFEEKQDQSLEFIRLKPKSETLSVTFEPDHNSTPKTYNEDNQDDSDVEPVKTPEWKLPESESDSGLDSDSDSELDQESKDFPFRIVKGKELFPKSRVPFIDTHCHLDYLYVREKHYTSFRSYIHKKDFPMNFSGCITCFCDPPAINDPGYYREVLSEEGVWGTFGLHPHNAAWYSDDLLEVMKTANSHPKSLAWGEIGLDYTAKTTDETKHVQQRVFVAQLKAAVAMGKPIVIHGRCAHEDTFSLLKQYVPAEHKIHYHCFSASLIFAERLIDFFPNLFIGITGVLTYSNAELEKIVQEFPFERILVETDSPFMKPSCQSIDTNTPRTSTPGMGVIVSKKIADVKGLELDDVLIQIRENVSEMYGI